MKKTIIFYLVLAGVSEFFILLFVYGICNLQIDFWEWRDPDTPVGDTGLNAIQILKVGLFTIPALLLIFVIGYLANRISNMKVGIHALGISLFLTACLVGLALSQVLSPMFSRMTMLETVKEESTPE